MHFEKISLCIIFIMYNQIIHNEIFIMYNKIIKKSSKNAPRSFSLTKFYELAYFLFYFRLIQTCFPIYQHLSIG